jgi:nitrate/TMAO reductase-like tetraheme cytochrome c subunit
MKKERVLTALIFALVISLTAIRAETLDYPHTGVNNIGCYSCHFVFGEPSLLPGWTAHVPQDIDDSQYNSLCRDCHNGLDAPDAKPHSSFSTDSDYGEWAVECRTCHNPHEQEQFKKYGSPVECYRNNADRG